MAPCRDRNPTPIRFEERRIQGLFGLKTTLLLVLKQSRAGARFWGRAGRFQTQKQGRLFYAGHGFPGFPGFPVFPGFPDFSWFPWFPWFPWLPWCSRFLWFLWFS